MIKIHKRKLHFCFWTPKKAFNNVNWKFMEILMNKLNLGKNFINAIQAIYAQQTASIIVNNEKTRNINIQKGTQQGCPLSLLLFIMVLEILLKTVQKDPEIYGIRCKGFQCKYRQYFIYNGRSDRYNAKIDNKNYRILKIGRVLY